MLFRSAPTSTDTVAISPARERSRPASFLKTGHAPPPKQSPRQWHIASATNVLYVLVFIPIAAAHYGLANLETTSKVDYSSDGPDQRC